MLNDFKPVLKILLRFVILYLAMVLAYQFYLNQFRNAGLDPVSQWVADQAAFVQDFLGYRTQLVPGKPEQETEWFYVSGRYVSRMVEGCNAVSVMVLFLAFVFAFFQGAKTFLFAGLGFVFLHFINVLRIAGLNILLVEWPQYSKIGHDYLFPAIIYGSVVLFWLIWIKFFALQDANHETA